MMKLPVSVAWAADTGTSLSRPGSSTVGRTGDVPGAGDGRHRDSGRSCAPLHHQAAEVDAAARQRQRPRADARRAGRLREDDARPRMGGRPPSRLVPRNDCDRRRRRPDRGSVDCNLRSHPRGRCESGRPHAGHRHARAGRRHPCRPVRRGPGRVARRPLARHRRLPVRDGGEGTRALRRRASSDGRRSSCCSRAGSAHGGPRRAGSFTGRSTSSVGTSWRWTTTKPQPCSRIARTLRPRVSSRWQRAGRPSSALAALTDDLDLPEGSLPDALYEYFAEELYQAATPEAQRRLCRLATCSFAWRMALAEFLLGRRYVVRSSRSGVAPRVSLRRVHAEPRTPPAPPHVPRQRRLAS